MLMRDCVLSSTLCAGSLGLAPIPLDGSLQSLFETHCRFIAEELFGLRDIGQGVLDVAATFGAMEGEAVVRSKSLKQLEGLVERDSSTSRHVEYFASHFSGGGLACQKVSIDGIVNVGEIPAVLAIAKHCGLLPSEHQRNKFCQHA